jgi:hypothetical protein
MYATSCQGILSVLQGEVEKDERNGEEKSTDANHRKLFC